MKRNVLPRPGPALLAVSIVCVALPALAFAEPGQVLSFTCSLRDGDTGTRTVRSFKVDPAHHLVDGHTARFGPKSVVWRERDGDKLVKLRLDRTTGEIKLLESCHRSEASPALLLGQCTSRPD